MCLSSRTLLCVNLYKLIEFASDPPLKIQRGSSGICGTRCPCCTAATGVFGLAIKGWQINQLSGMAMSLRHNICLAGMRVLIHPRVYPVDKDEYSA
jgi:hypothetical protein